jgi:uncharacterized protein YndB with AHSA1/START domain
MTTTPAVEPIRKQLVVAAPQATCFEVFTSGMGSWWNRAYSIGNEPLAAVVLEPRAGGRWFERGEHGAECDWGTVQVWEPPHRVALTWQITADWKYDPTVVTELDIRFDVAGPDSTTVTLEHRGLEALGDQAAMMRAIFDSPDGWSGLLDRFASSAAG